MNNVTRFGVGLLALLFGFLISGIVALLIAPFFVAGSIVFAGVTSLVFIVAAVVGFFCAVWYVTREEAEDTSDNYAITQNKDV